MSSGRFSLLTGKKRPRTHQFSASSRLVRPWRTESFTKATGTKTEMYPTAAASRSGRMGPVITVSVREASEMALVDLCMLMVTFTRAHGKAVRQKASAFLPTSTAPTTRATGTTTSNMGTASSTGRTVRCSRAPTNLDSNRAKVRSPYQTRARMSVTISKTTCTAKANTRGRTAGSTMALGWKTKWRATAASRLPRVISTRASMPMTSSMVSALISGQTDASTSASGKTT